MERHQLPGDAILVFIVRVLVSLRFNLLFFSDNFSFYDKEEQRQNWHEHDDSHIKDQKYIVDHIVIALLDIMYFNEVHLRCYAELKVTFQDKTDNWVPVNRIMQSIRDLS